MDTSYASSISAKAMKALKGSAVPEQCDYIGIWFNTQNSKPETDLLETPE